jgi:putative inorganic carbon (HCO3(-)) transporter
MKAKATPPTRIGNTARLLSAVRLAVDLEWLAVLLTTPLLLFPTLRPLLTAVSLTVLVSIWLLRWLLRREPWPITPFNSALLLFATMIPVAIWASEFPDLTLPKASGLILGLATFRAVALTVRDRRSLNLALAAFCLLGTAIVLVGVLSAQWTSKVASLGLPAHLIPRLITSLPDMQSAGVNPNQLAGVLTLYVPFAVTLVIALRIIRKPSIPHLLALAGTALALFLTVVILLLTQSRAGWIGGTAGLLALGTLWGLRSRRRWTRLAGAALPLVALASVAALLLCLGPYRVGEILSDSPSNTPVEEVVGKISITGRVEIWSRALYTVQYFPFTGCGLGTFRRVVPNLYPLFLIPPDIDIAHAHNIFLQTALDLGLPGLIAYLALLGIAVATCWRCTRHGDRLVRATALGLPAGLVGLHVYGLADALALGSKPGLAFWFILGLIAALPRITRQEIPEDAPASRITPYAKRPQVARFTRYVRTHPRLITLAAFLTLVLIATSVYLGWHAFREAPTAQPAIRLPLYPAAREIEVRAEAPAPSGDWVGQLEVATFSTADPPADVAAFYTDALAAGGWQLESEAIDETNWGGIYTKNDGRFVCLLNAFAPSTGSGQGIEGQTQVSIVCGDKREPVDTPPLPSGD